MSAWTSARDGHVQTSPLLNANSTRPSTALSRNASSWAMTSLKKMFGRLPPSSAVTGMMFSAAYCIISLPVVVSPVNPIFAIRGLVQADIYDAFMERVLVRMKAIKQGNPLDTETMVGPQVSIAQLEKISGYVDIGRGEGCEVLTGGAPATMAAPYDGGYYYQPTILK